MVSKRRTDLDVLENEFVKYLLDTPLQAQRLPRKCSATFIITSTISKRVVAVKMFAKPKAPEWQLKSGKFRGLCLLWLAGQTVLLVDSRLHISSLVYLPTVTKTLSNYVVNKTQLVTSLMKFLDASSESVEEICLNVKAQIGSVVVAAKKRESFTLEAASQAELIKILGTDRYLLTPEGCKADAGFRPSVTDSLFLPIQTKSCTQGTTGRLNVFSNTAGYPQHILLCRPMLSESVGTLVIPGAIAPKTIGLCLSAASKYMPFVVKDDDLLGLLKSLYKAVTEGSKSFAWPSGLLVNIDLVRLANIDIISTPQSKQAKIERDAFIWRRSNFPDVLYACPSSLQGTVDCIIDGVRVQDKVAISNKGRVPVSLSKRMNTGKHQPYSAGDFDALFVFLRCRQYYFFIPAVELLKRGALASPNKGGMQTVHLYTDEYKYRKGIRPDLWSNKYCYRSDDKKSFQRALDQMKSIRH